MSIEKIAVRLAFAQSKLESYQQLSADPKLSFAAKIAMKCLTRSYRTLVRLSHKALTHEIEKAGDAR
jgi:hypothetical protein